MRHDAKLDREDTIRDVLRAVDATIGAAKPTAQALAIIVAIKRLQSATPLFVTPGNRIDYLERSQTAARAEWMAKKEVFGSADECIGPGYDAVAGVDTPLGRLKTITWRRPKGDKIAWAAEYYLDDEPITINEIKRAGLAQRPHTRNRQRKATT